MYTIENFLDEKEVDDIVAVGDLLAGPGVGQMFSHTFMSDQYKRNAAPAVIKLERKIALLSQMEPHSQETPLQYTITRPGEFGNNFLRNVHHDHNQAGTTPQNQRAMAVVIYLSDAKYGEGGHTIFPGIPSESQGSNPNIASRMRTVLEMGYAKGERSMSPYKPDGSGPSDNSKPGGNWAPEAFKLMEKECVLALHGKNNVLAVTPKKGMALVFPSVMLDDREVPNTVTWHGVCHPAKGGLRRAINKFKCPAVAIGLPETFG